MKINEKHLEFLQNNISRMNQCSTKMKTWAITIVSAFLALFGSSINSEGPGNKAFIFIAIFPTFLFWMLDSFYLAKERRFIENYNFCANILNENKIKINDYEISPNKFKNKRNNFFVVMFSLTELLFYLSIIVGLVLFGIFI